MNHLTIYGFFGSERQEKMFYDDYHDVNFDERNISMFGQMLQRYYRVKKITEFTLKFVTFLNHFHKYITFHVFSSTLVHFAYFAFVVLFTF